METYQERVIAEKKELDLKLGKLKAFTESEAFKQISPDEQGRMNRQHAAMEDYSNILGERIANFGEKWEEAHAETRRRRG